MEIIVCEIVVPLPLAYPDNNRLELGVAVQVKVVPVTCEERFRVKSCPEHFVIEVGSNKTSGEGCTVTT